MISPDEIAADRAVIDAATDGPWEVRGGEPVLITAGEHGYDDVLAPEEVSCSSYCYGGSSRYGLDPRDAAFITAARTGWPRALDALEEAQAGRDEAIREARLSREATGKARAEVERLRESLVDANVEVERLRRDKVEITVSRGIDPKDPEGVTLRIEGSGEAWDFHVTDFTRYTTPPKWDVSRRAESAEAQVAALRERVADLEGQLAMRGAS